jgi:hypothetical protein
MALLSQTIRAFTDDLLSGPARSAMLADFARAELTELQGSGQAGQAVRRIVDGVTDAPETAVRGDGSGRIVYLFGYQAEAAVRALAYLRRRVPVGEGTYRDSFYLGIDGRFVPAGQFRPEHVPDTAEIVIGNTQPYSRKIDVQLVGGDVLHFTRPPGIFDDAARIIRRDFGGLVNARRVNTIRFPGQYRVQTGVHTGELVQSPALILTPGA